MRVADAVVSALATVVAVAVMSSPVPAQADAAKAVLAQAGSSGGSLVSPESIGKTDKSLSSRTPAQAPAVTPPPPPAAGGERQAPARPKRAVRARPAGAGARCPSIVGTWSSWASGFMGRNDTTFSADGSAHHRAGIHGRWWCEAGVLHIEWPDGRPGVVTLSSDGKTILAADGRMHARRD